MRMRQLADNYARCHPLAPATVQQIETAINFWITRFGDSAVGLAPPALAEFSMSLSMDSSPATANKHRAHLKSVLVWAHAMGLIDGEPYWRGWQRLPESRRAPQAFTVEEFNRGLVVARGWPGWVGGVPAGAWWESLLLSIWYSGARIGAALHVTWDDVLLDRQGFYVRAAYQKQRADQFFRVGPDCVAALQAAREPARRLVWPWPHRREALYRSIRRIFRLAGLPLSQRTGGLFHRIRRSTASYIHAGGGNATTQLGHSCSSVTERYYDPRIVGAHDSTPHMPPLDPH